MSRDEHIAGLKNPGAWIAALLLALVPLVATTHGTGSGDIVVTSASGDARFEHRGVDRPARRGAVVLLPSTARTGHDGAMDLAQGATTLSIGADTELEFPEGPSRGAPVERIVQKSGKAFYDVAKRDGRKLRVETPYLVAVIKGTQFSVSVQDGATSISLIEGQLQILTPDNGATVEINAGQIASRRQGDADIAVVSADGPQVRVPGATGAVASVDERPAGGVVGAVANVGAAAAVDTRVVGTTVRVDVDVDVDADAGAGIELDTAPVSADAGVSLGLGPDGGASVDIGASTGIAGVDTSTSVGANVTPTSVDVGLGVGVGDVNTGVGISVGTGGVDTTITPVLPVDTGAETLTTVVEDVGGLVSGLPTGLRKTP